MLPALPLLPVATADDRDLDLDVTGLVLTDVARSGDDVVLQAVGDFPVRSVGGSAQQPTHPTRTHVEITVGTHDALPVTDVVRRLQEWCETRTPLRLLAAPGKHMALVSHDGTVLPLPRSA